MTKPRTPLAPVEKTYSLTPSGTRVCTGAVTADGEWTIRQFEDDRTTWSVKHVATGTEVGYCLRNLRECQRYIGSGDALKDLRRLQAHAHGEHADHDPACAKCRAEADVRFARHEGVHQLGGHRRQHDPECTLCTQVHRRAA